MFHGEMSYKKVIRTNESLRVLVISDHGSISFFFFNSLNRVSYDWAIYLLRRKVVFRQPPSKKTTTSLGPDKAIVNLVSTRCQLISTTTNAEGQAFYDVVRLCLLFLLAQTLSSDKTKFARVTLERRKAPWRLHFSKISSNDHVSWKNNFQMLVIRTNESLRVLVIE